VGPKCGERMVCPLPKYKKSTAIMKDIATSDMPLGEEIASPSKITILPLF